MRVAVAVRGDGRTRARPWMGVNAIHRLGALAERVDGFDERRPVLDGCEYRESLQAVRVEGGVANNVVPDEVRLAISHRFAPDRDTRERGAGCERVPRPGPRRLARGHGRARGCGAGGAARASATRCSSALVTASGAAPRAKLGWTDVAFFAERGVPAANFGPGDPLLAHTVAEHVRRSELEHAYATLAALLRSG